MGAFDNSVQVNITIAGRSVPSTGFGVPLLAGAATFAERVRTYTTTQSISDDETAGVISAAVSLGLRTALLQSPRVSAVKMGRVEADVAQVVTFTFSGTPEIGDRMQVTINGVLTDYTVASAVLNTEVDALRAAMVTALAAEPVTVAGVSPDITVTANVAGTPFTYSSAIVLTAGGDLAVSEVLTTANRSVSTELDLILAADADWYGLAIESRADLQIQRAAAWAEGNERLFIGQSSDSDLLANPATDIASVLAALSYTRTAVLYHADDAEWADMAWFGLKLAADPDLVSTIWRYATLVGITADTLTDTQITEAYGKPANLYALFFETGAVQKGVTVDGTPIDLRITADWLRARIRERIASILLDASNRNEKVPYTDVGISVFVEAVRAIVAIGENAGHFTPGTLSLTPPLRANVPSADVQARLLNLEFEVEAAGAIEEVTIQGFVVIDL